MEEKTYFCIRDVSHNGFIGAGSHHNDGFIYHYTDENGENEHCQWFFEEVKDAGTSSPVYYIFNKKYNTFSIVAGDYQDGHVYLQPPSNRRNAEWFIEHHIFGKTRAFKITDNKHEKSLCASQLANKCVNHYDVTDAKNGGWQLLVASEGKDLSNLPFCYENRIIGKNPKNTKKQIKNVITTKLVNDTSEIKTCELSKTYKSEFENSIYTDNIISKNTMLDIETNLGIENNFIDVSAKTEFIEETYNYNRTSTNHHVKIFDEIAIHFKYDVNPKKTVLGRAEISVDEISSDYTAEVHFQKLDGGFLAKNIKGSYKIENNLNVSYVYSIQS